MQAAHENKCGCISAAVGRIGESLSARVGRIGGNLNASISLVCTVSEPKLVVYPIEADFTYEGGMFVINVQCNTNWEVR